MSHQMDVNEIITVTYKMEIQPGHIAEPWQPTITITRIFQTIMYSY